MNTPTHVSMVRWMPALLLLALFSAPLRADELKDGRAALAAGQYDEALKLFEKAASQGQAEGRVGVGQVWLRRSGRSQEFFDSLVIAAWGCVNTFTEHHWGGPWVRNDLQHTAMGIIWWCAGLVGIWLSRTRDGMPKRNLIPGIVLLLTGWGMSAHPQALPLSNMVHTVFGYTLMAGKRMQDAVAGLLRGRRHEAGALTFHTTELQPVMSPEGTISGVCSQSCCPLASIATMRRN